MNTRNTIRAASNFLRDPFEMIHPDRLNSAINSYDRSELNFIKNVQDKLKESGIKYLKNSEESSLYEDLEFLNIEFVFKVLSFTENLYSIANISYENLFNNLINHIKSNGVYDDDHNEFYDDQLNLKIFLSKLLKINIISQPHMEYISNLYFDVKIPVLLYEIYPINPKDFKDKKEYREFLKNKIKSDLKDFLELYEKIEFTEFTDSNNLQIGLNNEFHNILEYIPSFKKEAKFP
jgi:hypothetical protein